MFNIKAALTASALVVTLGLSTMTQAKADGAASTRNILIGAAALVAGIAIEQNVAHKNARANSIQGYTRNGDTVYDDGRIVDRNGQTYYPGNNGQQVSCDGQSCVVTATGNDGYYGDSGSGYAGNGRYDGYGANGGYGSYANGRGRNH